ncbi:MAG: hypothetical protein FJ294_05340 [Planctomycetes bacterium]|nr:hypothetical protein [Planctomycetota bacterium]
MKLARPILAHALAVLPALAAYRADARASLASLSLLGWAFTVHLAFALVPHARGASSRSQHGLGTLALAAPSLALGMGLDAQAGAAWRGLLALAAIGALSLALLAAAAPRGEREGRAVLASRALFVLLPALLGAALTVCGLEHDTLARALCASPLASAWSVTLRVSQPLALAPLGAAAVLGAAVLAAREERERA